MAKPRVFISSNFYDLRQIREDLERSIRELGYEPIRNETGSISYGKDSPPETYAYKELELCDILVSIIGGRYGTESKEEFGYSISQTELKRALDRGIQVFIFIEKSVNAEFETYRINKENNSIKYKFVAHVPGAVVGVQGPGPRGAGRGSRQVPQILASVDFGLAKAATARLFDEAVECGRPPLRAHEPSSLTTRKFTNS